MFAQSVAKVNCILMLHADAPLPLAAVARAAGLTYNLTQSAIHTLEKHRVVTHESRAGQDLFGPDQASAYYESAYRTALVDLPIDAAIRGHRVLAVFVYGSLTTPNGGTRRSDLDLLLISDTKRPDELVFALSLVGQQIGRRIDPLVLTPEQLEEAQRREDAHILAAIHGIRIRGAI